MQLQTGELIKDWRRMNVSFTRARSKLIIIGSRKTLQQAPLLQDFFELMDSQSWIVTLPPNAHLMHASGGAVPKKRSATDMAFGNDVMRGALQDDGEKVKRARVIRPSGEGILTGRPLLRDVVNDRR